MGAYLKEERKMQFKIKPRKNKERWHHWFAWRPVTIGRYIVWLEFVAIRFVYYPCGDEDYTVEKEYRRI